MGLFDFLFFLTFLGCTSHSKCDILRFALNMIEMSQNLQNQRVRDGYIDLTRWISIMFIVIGHVNIRSPYEWGCPELSWMSVFGGWNIVMFFFFLSGYFMKPAKGWFAVKRAWQLFISMCIWCFIGYFCFGMIWQYEAKQAVDVWALLVSPNIFGIIGTLYSFATPGSMDLWFLKVLVALAFFSPLLMRLKTPLLLVAIVAFFLLEQFRTMLPASVAENVPYFLKCWVHFAMFSLGIVARRYVRPEQLQALIGRVWAYILVMCLVYQFFTVYGAPDLLKVAPYFACVLGIVYIFSLAYGVQKFAPRVAAWLSQYGVSVFFIYMVQEILVMWSKVYFTFHPINKHIYTVVPFIILAICMVLFRLILRLWPASAPYLLLYNLKK